MDTRFMQDSDVVKQQWYRKISDLFPEIFEIHCTNAYTRGSSTHLIHEVVRLPIDPLYPGKQSHPDKMSKPEEFEGQPTRWHPPAIRIWCYSFRQSLHKKNLVSGSLSLPI